MNSFTELQTKRFFLRTLKPADWEAISYLRSDRDVNKFVKRPSAETKEKALAFIKKIEAGIEDQSFYYWSISEAQNSEMIGSICLWNFSEDRKTAEVGYDLNPTFQGKGVMDEALKKVTEFGFNHLLLNAIEAFTQKDNLSSTNLLERNDFKLNTERVDKNNRNNCIFERVL
jgi:ribosomal-protein-alanine N-acetyltransferase